MTTATLRLARDVSTLPRPLKFGILVLLDLLTFLLAIIASVALRYSDAGDDLSFSRGLDVHLPVIVFGPILGVILLASVGCYSEVLRYSGSRLVGRLALATVLLVAATTTTSFLLDREGGQSRSVLIMFGALSFLGLWSLRTCAKYLLNLDGRTASVNALIYGAGVAGAGLASALSSDRSWRLVGFVDDNRNNHGRTISGLRVYPSSDLPELTTKHGVQTVFLALPSIGKKPLQEIYNRLEPFGVKVLSVPTLEELIAGQAKFRDFRQVETENILGRDAVDADERLVLGAIGGRVVLVTGGGGSIGSELCRQIVAAEPRRVIVFDHSEFNLYQIGQDLQPLAESAEVEVELVLGSVLDTSLLRDTFRRCDVDVVFHAAAYKHVPLVEGNVVAGVETNAIGTLRTLDAAIEHQVERFVMISTDKAVRPTNAMGASKRIAEVIVQDRAARIKTRGETPSLGIVRFGNVIGSSGSVVPLFKRQIAEGGPLTVTHSEVTRFFMSIPEASSLVIQAAAMTRGGDVFLLDMGPPVRILDLARTMIEMNGFTVKDDENPNGDLEIKVVGLRPGEKIHEELLIDDDASPSDHPRIRRAVEHHPNHDDVASMVVRLEAAVAERDVDVIRTILETHGDLGPEIPGNTA